MIAKHVIWLVLCPQVFYLVELLVIQPSKHCLFFTILRPASSFSFPYTASSLYRDFSTLNIECVFVSLYERVLSMSKLLSQMLRKFDCNDSEFVAWCQQNVPADSPVINQVRLMDNAI